MNFKAKTYLRASSIIGAIIGVILMIVIICIDNSTSGIMLAAGLLFACCGIGICIGILLEKSKGKADGDTDEITESKTESDSGTITESKAESSVEVTAEGKEETNVEVTVESKEESNVEATTEGKAESNVETTTESKAENNAEVTTESKAEDNNEANSEDESKSEKKISESDKEKKSESIDETAPEEIVKPEEETGFFKRLVAGLTKTRNSLNESFNNIFSGFSSIDDDFYDELEETLIMADLGLDTTEKIIDNLKDIVKKNHIKETAECRELVINIIKDQMLVEDEAYDFEEQKTVMLIIGVNGVGKTTSIGKLAAQYKNRGKKVMMCAADTFRAAAIDQLKTWANRAGVEIIAQDEGADPAAVTFDAVKAASARNVDILLVDTAGRLHNKKNLMDELAKMKRIIEKEYSDAHLETLIVLDGSTGQNALEQARQFSNVTQIDGIILTKLDGTAKGGIAIAIQAELNVPVKYIGVGEQINDLQKFDPESYVNALFADMDTRSEIEILMPED